MIYAFDPSDKAWPLMAFFYSLSQLLDMADGYAARALDQCSRFGASLDMVCDRASCAAIYMVLMQIYPGTFYSYCFLTCFFLDFGSHFLQFCSSALLKSDSHKGKNKRENVIVHYYYNVKWFFGMIVICAEASSVTLLLLARVPALRDSLFCKLLCAFFTLNLATKMIINVFQWQGASERFL
mmetsp:Transcript_13097/g.22107  ORF Transcript_13097/g.22107 Transcript_13097/m.22107 type:complete len:182 (+) Transcript_13097:200-745(+)